MTDIPLDDLAARAGVARSWSDVFGQHHDVSDETILFVLDALGLPAETQTDRQESRERLNAHGAAPPLVTATVGTRIDLSGLHGEAVLESGETVRLAADGDGFRAPDAPGYHRLSVQGRDIVLAAAPRQGRSVADLLAGGRGYGAAAQIYSLRSADGDAGYGDFAALAEAAAELGVRGADALAISPTHAPFLADLTRVSPYAPSSRLVHNPLLASPDAVFGPGTMRRLLQSLGRGEAATRLDRLDLADWAEAGALRIEAFRALFAALPDRPDRLAAFESYRRAADPAVEAHARFEAIQAHVVGPGGAWDWRNWPADLRDADSEAVDAFAEVHADEIAFYVFLQWLAETSLSAAQKTARAAGMRIGLIADLAVGMDGAGSHAWSRRDDLLPRLTVGAPPDLLNRQGQSWGLSTFSPTALRATGFSAFIATLRAAMRHTGGLRIDHAMGLSRLWLVPEGGTADKGTYLSYPLADMLRLVALESHRHDAIVVGEDLGTVPLGFRETMDAVAMLGMRVLPFERAEHDRFLPAHRWSAEALGMTSTHDLAPVAGWWKGHDIDWREKISGHLETDRAARDTTERARDRDLFWQALREEGLSDAPQPAPDDPQPAVDAAIDYVGATPCRLALIPLEDILGLVEAPNIPGTIDEHPNWRRRLPGATEDILGAPLPARRLSRLAQRRSGR